MRILRTIEAIFVVLLGCYFLLLIFSPQYRLDTLFYKFLRDTAGKTFFIEENKIVVEAFLNPLAGKKGYLLSFDILPWAEKIFPAPLVLKFQRYLDRNSLFICGVSLEEVQREILYKKIAYWRKFKYKIFLKENLNKFLLLEEPLEKVIFLGLGLKEYLLTQGDRNSELDFISLLNRSLIRIDRERLIKGRWRKCKLFILKKED